MANEFNELNEHGEPNEFNTPAPEPNEKKLHVPSLVLMVIGAVFSLLLPLVAYICCPISLIMSIVYRKRYKTKYAIVINIIALVVALANSTLGVLLGNGTITLPAGILLM